MNGCWRKELFSAQIYFVSSNLRRLLHQETDSAEDWACGSRTEILTERHHINLFFLKGVKDKVKQQKKDKWGEIRNEERFKQWNERQLQVTMKYSFSKKTIMRQQSDLPVSLLRILFLEEQSPCGGEMQTLSHKGLQDPRCALFLLEQHLRWLDFLSQTLNTLYHTKSL